MKTPTVSDVVDVFLALPQEEQEEIFQIGAAFRLVDLRKQLALAEENIGRFEARYGMTLDELENQGLPEDADYEMHEDYVEWHYWVNVRDRTRQMLNILSKFSRVPGAGMWRARIDVMDVILKN